jgi:hypothetical protein
MRSAIVIGVILAGLAAPVQAQTGAALSDADLRELIDAAKATAKATRESVDHARVTPDIEDKLDKVENAIKRDNPVRKSTR